MPNVHIKPVNDENRVAKEIVLSLKQFLFLMHMVTNDESTELNVEVITNKMEELSKIIPCTRGCNSLYEASLRGSFFSSDAARYLPVQLIQTLGLRVLIEFQYLLSQRLDDIEYMKNGNQYQGYSISKSYCNRIWISE